MADPNAALKTEVDRDVSARTVLSSIRNHKDELILALGPKFSAASTLQGDAASRDAVAGDSVASTIEFLAALLEADRNALLAAGRAYRRAKAELSVHRRRRRESAGQCRSAMVTIRAEVIGTYGAATAEELGILQRIPRRIEAILEQASDLDERIRVPTELPPPAPGHRPVDLTELVERFAPVVEAFRAAVDSFQDYRRMVQLRRVERDQSEERYNGTFLWVARTFESLFRLADLVRLAEYVRPSTRRPGLTVRVGGPDNPPADQPTSPPDDEPDDDEPDDDEPDDDEPDGDEPDDDEPDDDPDSEL